MDPFSGIRDELRELRRLAAERRSGLVRLLTFANAGGVVATLSFIGTLITKSANGMFDRSGWYILLLFMLGLAVAWYARMLEWRMAEFEAEVQEKEVQQGQQYWASEDRPPPPDRSPLEAMSNRLNWAMSTMFTFASTGILVGMAKLWGISSP